MNVVVCHRPPFAAFLFLGNEAPSLIWDAQWQCPGCNRNVIERFSSLPTPEQLANIEGDPLCWLCRRRIHTATQFSLFRP